MNQSSGLFGNDGVFFSIYPFLRLDSWHLVWITVVHIILMSYLVSHILTPVSGNVYAHDRLVQVTGFRKTFMGT